MINMDDEAKQAIFEEKQAEKGLFNGIPEPEAPEAMEDISQGFTIDFSFLKTRTGPGEIENYLNNPFNFSHSKGLAQVLRGVTGFVGNLDLAIVDIFIGTYNMIKEGKAAPHGDNFTGQ